MRHMAILGAALGVFVAGEGAAAACGCFAQTTTATPPIVQGGERILFTVDNDVVTAYVQIFYAGTSPGDFGWLLPLPSVPTLDVATTKLFDELVTPTEPRFALTTLTPSCSGGGGGIGCGCGASDSALAAAGGAPSVGGPSPVVAQGDVGPYDYAVLKADDRTALTNWLDSNRYYVPTGQDVIGPYIHPGAFFLALKLHAGKTTGDIQPIVVQYPATTPMIPLVLTSATSVGELPVEVYVLGAARAVPRNYYHLVLDEAALDWSAPAKSYAPLVRRAIVESPTRRAFVTEYAGPSSIVQATDPKLAALVAKYGYLTRLYARLAPADMTADPAFDTNPDLPDVPVLTSARLYDTCEDSGQLETSDGFRVPTDAKGKPSIDPTKLPASRLVEVLRASGPPEIVRDNTGAITSILDGFTPPPQPQDAGIPDGISRRDARHRGELAVALVPLLFVLARLRRRRGPTC